MKSEMALVDEIRAACERVADRARWVSIDEGRLKSYASELPLSSGRPVLDPDAYFLDGSEEKRAAFVLTFNAINFGSGWWPTIRKRPGRSGSYTVLMGLKERFDAHGPWSPEELIAIEPGEIATVLGQDPNHELMVLFADALRDLGVRLHEEYAGRYLALVKAANGSAVALAERLVRWPSFADVSVHDSEPVPFFKRAQITSADLVHAGVAEFDDLERLTLFADNLIPHVLRVDGVLRYDAELAARIDGEQLLEHGSPEEVEIRACAVHAVELIVSTCGDTTAQEVDYLLWNRGQKPRYKSRPRHRARTTAY